MNLMDIERNKKILDYCSELLGFCDDDDKNVIEDIFKKSEGRINKVNKQHIKVYHYSKRERGIIFASIKRMCEAAFYSYNNRSNAINENQFFNDICNEIGEDEFIFNKYLSLKRHKNGWHHLDTPLQKAVRDSLRLEICNKFIEINKRLTGKTIKIKNDKF